MVLNSGFKGLKSTSAHGSSTSAHFPHILSLFIDTFSAAQSECAKWEGNYKWYDCHNVTISENEK